MQPNEGIDALGGSEVLCIQISGVDLSGYLSEVDPAAPYRLLDPEQVRIQVPEFTEALAIADANRGR